MLERDDLSHRSELDLTVQRINLAKEPEEVFGDLPVGDQVIAGRKVYYQLSKLIHPDLFADPLSQEVAHKTFIKLRDLWQKAQSKLEDGSYGQFTPFGKERFSIDVGRRRYFISENYFEGQFANFYPCIFVDHGKEVGAIFKINRESSNNDRVANEAKVLRKLAEADGFPKFLSYFPKVVDSFKFLDPGDPTPRQVNILSSVAGLYSLAEVRRAYPSGVDSKDMAWIWRRLLVGLGFAHHNDILHGAILPENLFIHPQKHGLVITEWSNALVDAKGAVSTIELLTAESASWYPRKTLTGEDLNPGLDIYMAAKTMIYLLGGDPFRVSLPDSIDRKIRAFLIGCTSVSYYPQDAWGLLEEFDSLIESLWGLRTYHPFTMPKRVCLNAFW